MTSLILALIGLSALLIFLVLIYVRIGKGKKAQENDAPVHTLTFEQIKAIIASSRSSQNELHRAVETLIREYIHISRERPLETYTALLQTLCIHPHTDSKLILQYEKALRAANSIYSDEIALALKEGLAARG